MLRLRNGPSADIYDIVSHDNTDTPTDSSDIQVRLLANHPLFFILFCVFFWWRN